MFEKSDQRFLQALASEEEFEKRLGSLTNQRRWSCILATALAVYIFAHVIFVLVTFQSTISDHTPFGLNVPPGMVLLPMIFLMLSLQWVVQAVVAHCEIRTLLIYKKLHDDKSVVTP